MRPVKVIGVGMIPFGKHPDRTLVDLSSEAAYLALKDAGVAPEKIDIGFFASAAAARLSGEVTVGQNVLWEVGIHKIPIINVENACTSGSTAVTLGFGAVASGQAEYALVVGGDKLWVPGAALIDSGQTELDTQLGLVAPASFALRATRHMKEFGTTAEQLASVAVKNRQHAMQNPMAEYRQPLTLEEVLASPMIVDPLTRFQCCPIADGASAVVLAAGDGSEADHRGVRLDAALLFTGSYENPIDLVRWETDFRSCRAAYERAGIGPEDLDLIECHDAFTIAEIMHYEALGLCAEGEGGRLAQSGDTALGGRIPVNPSGGLLSRGHPPGATGVAQIFEVVTQLRGEAGPRQVPGAKVGLAHCMGGDKAGDSKSCTVCILSR